MKLATFLVVCSSSGLISGRPIASVEDVAPTTVKTVVPVPGAGVVDNTLAANKLVNPPNSLSKRAGPYGTPDSVGPNPLVKWINDGTTWDWKLWDLRRPAGKPSGSQIRRVENDACGILHRTKCESVKVKIKSEKGSSSTSHYAEVGLDHSRHGSRKARLNFDGTKSSLIPPKKSDPVSWARYKLWRKNHPNKSF